MMKDKIKNARMELQNDENLRRVAKYTKAGIRALPSASLHYTVEKTPIVQWLPKYSPKWILNDLVAGLTVGILLIPQGLAYAKIATLPVEVGLMSSWLPALIYTLMGTSKDLSTGPTSIIGLLTADIIKDFVEDGFSPQIIASAVALMVGVYSLILGLLKLGFLLDFISAPVLSGFISAAAIVIILGQVPSLLGLSNIGSGTSNTIHDVFATLSKSKWPTVLVGLSGIFLLQLLQFAGKRLGKKNKIIWALSIGRAAIVLVLFTGLSFGLNKDRPKKPVFDISAVTSSGIKAPRIPHMELISRVAIRAVAPFIAAALEHIAIGKAFAAKNNYRLDESQELTYLGLTNFFNSWFGAMPVGGAMSRTAVNSDAGVKSPLNGLFTAGFVLLGIYKLTGALFWIPKATLAAIIVTAVYHLIGPLSIFYRMWQTSFMDFCAAMVCFWVTLFTSAEFGIGFAVLFAIAWTLLRAAFSSVVTVMAPCQINGTGQMWQKEEPMLHEIPEDTRVFRFVDSVLFSNAVRVKDAIMDELQVHHSGLAATCLEDANDPAAAKDSDRTWSVAREKRVARLRKKAGIVHTPPPLRVVILDFCRVSAVDFTGLYTFSGLKTAIAEFAGPQCEIRAVNMDDAVTERFARFGWVVKSVSEIASDRQITTHEPKGVEDWSEVVAQESGVDLVVYPSLALAIPMRG